MDFGSALEHYVKVKRTAEDPPEGYEARMVDGEPVITRWEYPFPKPTQSELEAADLEARKAAKIDEFAMRAVADLEPYFTGSHGDRETIYALAKYVQALCTATGVPLTDQRILKVIEVGDKAMSKKADIGNAESPEELEAIEWEDQA